MFSAFESEDVPRFEGIETPNYVVYDVEGDSPKMCPALRGLRLHLKCCFAGGPRLSEDVPRFEGIETPSFREN